MTMKRKEVIDIIYDEKLSRFNLDEDRSNREYEVVIRKKEDKWEVYLTGERTTIDDRTLRIFDNEEEAYDYFIEQLRAKDEYCKSAMFTR